MLKHHKSSLLVALLILSLTGIQLFKDSPWHHHSQETADCVLCHFENHDDTLQAEHAGKAAVKKTDRHLSWLVQHQRGPKTQAYHSRAPPQLFL